MAARTTTTSVRGGAAILLIDRAPQGAEHLKQILTGNILTSGLNDAAAIVPLYAPGLPLLMALGQAIFGFCGAFFVVPLCAALTIWLTYAVGRRVFDRPGIALWGAALVAASPVFLYQSMNAMSDVPVTAACTTANTRGARSS